MEYIQTIKLDLKPSGPPPVVYVKQGDHSAPKILAKLYVDGRPYTLEEETIVMFRAEKPDGHSVYLDSISLDSDVNRYYVIANGGNVTVELVYQVMTVAGVCKCDICLSKDGQIISTLPFIIKVIEEPDLESLGLSEDFFRTLGNAYRNADNMWF